MREESSAEKPTLEVINKYGTRTKVGYAEYLEMIILQEEWVKWSPLENLNFKLYIEKLIDDKTGLQLFLQTKDMKQTIKVSFENHVLSYRNTDEGGRLKTLRLLSEKYENGFYAEWTLFKVINSNYVAWFNQESHNIYSNLGIEHYVFLTCDDVVDVLSSYEPQVTIIEDELNHGRGPQ